MITLRAIEPEDLTLLYIWENDRSVWRVSNTLAPFSKALLQQYIMSDPSNIFVHRQLRMMIDLKGAQRRTVGAVDLFDFDAVHRRAGTGILIAAEEDRKQGFASEAVRQIIDYSKHVLFLHQLYCNIAASNTVSLHLFEKTGFSISGVKKEWLKTTDGWEDELFLQLQLDHE
ncbi:MAG: GNAT family N-acetyltransferase [Bacteroidales bacterium]|jgi:diamine N-acetyltransferase|nr:GNAT family N-acetyltransferase [Bacteroidales bacterium]